MFGITPPSQNPFSFNTFTRFSSFAPHLLMSPISPISIITSKSQTPVSNTPIPSIQKIYSHTRFLASNITTLFPSIHSILKAFTPFDLFEHSGAQFAGASRGCRRLDPPSSEKAETLPAPGPPSLARNLEGLSRETLNPKP